jgi:hypothetical protein
MVIYIKKEDVTQVKEQLEHEIDKMAPDANTLTE